MQGVLGVQHMPLQVHQDSMKGLWVDRRYASTTANGLSESSAWVRAERRAMFWTGTARRTGNKK